MEQSSTQSSGKPPDIDKRYSRIVVKEMVYHQQMDSQPTCVESGFVRILGTDEQPYMRKTQVGQEWTPLDCGWIDKAGMIVLENCEGRFLQVTPTEEERAEAEKRIIELAFQGGNDCPSILVLPGETCRFHPVDVGRIFLRSQHGTAKFTVTLFPV